MEFSTVFMIWLVTGGLTALVYAAIAFFIYDQLTLVEAFLGLVAVLAWPIYWLAGITGLVTYLYNGASGIVLIRRKR